MRTPRYPVDNVYEMVYVVYMINDRSTIRPNYAISILRREVAAVRHTITIYEQSAEDAESVRYWTDRLDSLVDAVETLERVSL